MSTLENDTSKIIKRMLVSTSTELAESDQLRLATWATKVAFLLEYWSTSGQLPHEIREWEVAGTAHYDTYGLVESMADTGNGTADVKTFDTMINPVSAFDGGAISCPVPLNAGAHTYELRAAVVALNSWIITGNAPPQSPRLDVASSSSFVTNQNGEAEGGIQTPQVEAPIAVVNGTGDTSSAGGGFCGLFGATIPFSAAKLAQLYPTHAAFVKKWDRAVAADVRESYLLPADAKVLDRVAKQSTIGG
jgi:hypothetical protein